MGLVTSGLLAQYAFADGSGSTLTDSSGNAYHGTLGAAAAAPTWTAGATGGLTFPSGTYVNIPSNPWTSAVTIQAVVAPAGSSHRAIIGASSSGIAWMLTPSSTQELFRLGTGLITSGNEVFTEIAQCVTAIFNPTADQFFRSETENTYATHGGSSAVPRGSGQIGGGGSGFPFQGTIYSLMIYNRALSQAEIAQNRAAMQAAIAARGSTKIQIFFDGNSLVLGSQNTTPADRFYNKAVALLTQGETTLNLGAAGATTPQRIGSFVSQYSVLRPRNVVLIWEITNDLRSGASVATAESDIDAYIANCKAIGAEYVIGTCLPGNGNAESDRQAVNAYVRANYPAKNIADFGADPTIGAAGASSNTTYYLDGTHLAAAGNTIAANIFYSTLVALGVEPLRRLVTPASLMLSSCPSSMPASRLF